MSESNEIETSGFYSLDKQSLAKEEHKPVVQEILQGAISNTTFVSSNLLDSACYASNDASATDSCMSLPASTVLLTAKPFKSRIPVRRGGATTPSDYDRMSNCSGRSTPTFYNSLDPLTSSFTNGFVNVNYESKEDFNSLVGTVPPIIAPKPAYIKGQLPRRLNKMSLKRETSLPPLAFGTILSQNSTPKNAKQQTTKAKQDGKPSYVRSNSSMSMYEERKKSRDEQQLQRLGYLPVSLNISSRRGSIDNVFGGETESVSSTRCSTPNRLMGSMSKIPVWTGSQETLDTFRPNTNNNTNNNSGQKTPTSNRMLPPIPSKMTTSASGNKVCGTTKVKKLATKKWESCSSLEVSAHAFKTVL